MKTVIFKNYINCGSVCCTTCNSQFHYKPIDIEILVVCKAPFQYKYYVMCPECGNKSEVVVQIKT